MANELEPAVGQWYWHHDKGQSFVVLALDNDLVEIQHYDGDIEAMDSDAWHEMDIELSEPPEDWTGPVDDVETDDLDYSDAAMDRQSWEERGREYRRPPEPLSNDPEFREEEDEENPGEV